MSFTSAKSLVLASAAVALLALAGPVTPAAFADPGAAPTAVTGANPIATGGMSGLLSATVNPNGVDTSAYVQVGDAGHTVLKTAAQDVGAGTDPVALSFPVNLTCPYRAGGYHPGHLLPGQTYSELIPYCPEKFSYRVIATNANGTATGARMIFNPGALGVLVLHLDARDDGDVSAYVTFGTLSRPAPQYTVTIGGQSGAGGVDYVFVAPDCAPLSIVSANFSMPNLGCVSPGPVPTLSGPHLIAATPTSLSMSVKLWQRWGFSMDCGGTVTWIATDSRHDVFTSPTVGTCQQTAVVPAESGPGPSTSSATISGLSPNKRYWVHAHVVFSNGALADTYILPFTTPAAP